LQRSFTSTADGGLRTFSGGQISIQVANILAVQTNAAAPVLMDAAHSVRDVVANVGTPPAGGSISLQVTQNGQPYCQLSIPDGASTSYVIDGATLPALPAEAQIGLDILSVPPGSDTVAGADLTVTIRL
jgi:hypothetical protein